MGLSRNKVAVSEGAAGSPPFYGDHEEFSRIPRSRNDEMWSTMYGDFCCSIFRDHGSLKKREPMRNGGVAQLGEHLPCKQGVMGSNPIISTSRRNSTPKHGTMETNGERLKERSVAQVVRAHA